MAKNKAAKVVSIDRDTYSFNDYLRDQQDEITTKGADFDLVRDGTADGMAGLWEADVKAFMSAMTLKAMFYAEDWVYIIVDLMASKISAQPLNIMKGTVVNGTMKKEKADNHPLMPMIEQPNKFQDYHAWMYVTCVDLGLLGNTIMWRAPSMKSIIPLPAEAVIMDFDQLGGIRRYMAYGYSTDDNRIQGATAFDPRQIIHMRRPNPSSMLWGLSPFIPGRKSILFNRYSSEYLNNFYLKSATPGMALEMGAEANENVALRLLRSFETAYTGRRNQRRTLVLPKGVTAKPVDHTLADQQLATYIDKNRETILALLKVPKHELGLQTAGSLGSEEYKHAIRNFWAATLTPMMRIITGNLNKFFAAELGPDYFFEFDVSDVEALKEDEVKKGEIARGMLLTHTVNEIRKKVYSDPPISGGDVAPVPPASKPAGFGPTTGLSVDPAVSPTLTGTNPGDTVGSQVGSRSPATLSTETTKTKDTPAKKIGDTAAFKGGADGWFNKREGKISEVAGKSIDAMTKQSLDLFSKLAPAIIRTVRKNLIEKGYPWASAVMATKGIEAGNPKASVINRTEMRRRIREAINKFEQGWTDEGTKTLVSAIDVGYDVTLSYPFNMPSQNEIAAIRERGVDGRRSIIEERQFTTFDGMSKTTTDDVMNIVDRGIAENKTVDEIAQDIATKYRNVEDIGYRANTIARTEVLTAVSLGQAAAMKDASTVIPDLQKMWLSADDDRVRESHVAVDGEVTGWDEPFSNNLFFPRDPKGGASEVINCRCTFVALPKGQMDEVSGDNLSSNEVG